MAERVALSTFINFVGSNAPSTRVDAARQHVQPYDRRKDFYARLREAIVGLVRDGGSSKQLDVLLVGLHSRKVTAYEAAIAGFKAWHRKNKTAWVPGHPARMWTSGDLQVKVQADLVVEIRREIWALKLWLNNEQPSRRAIGAAQYLLNHAYSGVDRVGLLDVKREHIRTAAVGEATWGLVLQGEAAAFLAIVQQLRLEPAP